MSMAYRHKSSSYWREHEIRNSTEITATMEIAEPDQSSRLLNENIDILISRLSPIESEIFRLYILPGFSYDELSKETGVPVKYLYSRVQTALNKIKKNVYIRKAGSISGAHEDV
jgi:DNA-directed RNA polymerase specialized sigma24 family protein